MSIYEQGLGRAAVNHVALSPLSFIERTAAVYPHYPAVVHGSIRRNWAETYARCRRLADGAAQPLSAPPAPLPVAEDVAQGWAAAVNHGQAVAEVLTSLEALRTGPQGAPLSASGNS